MSVRICGALAAGFVTLLAAGCATQDHFPMRNPETTQEVMCVSGKYWIKEGAPQMRIATQCMQACAVHGFRRHTGNPYADYIQPKAPDEDVKQYIPAACLP